MAADQSDAARTKTGGSIAKSRSTQNLKRYFYRADNGIKWRNLPKDLPPWQTVYGYFRLWVRLGVWSSINQALVGQVRMFEGREAEPSLTIIDGQSGKLGEEGGLKLGSMVIRK